MMFLYIIKSIVRRKKGGIRPVLEVKKVIGRSTLLRPGYHDKTGCLQAMQPHYQWTAPTGGEFRKD